MTSNLVAHAERELKRAGFHKPDADYGGDTFHQVMQLIGTFAGFRPSGALAELITEVFVRLARFETLTPITDDMLDWAPVDDYLLGDDQEPLWQNIRNPSLFSSDEGKTYYDVNGPMENDGSLPIHTSLPTPKESNA